MLFSALISLQPGSLVCSAGAAPQTGPETEKRFPPLKVPTGFQATLFACDPLVEYPSAIALGPRAGSIFVAVDYMTGLGAEIVRRDEIRLIEDTDGDGYADKATVYATGFNSIEGMTFHDGVVYVMHSPLLTALRDTDDDGVADERRELLTGLGLPPEENPHRLHCANGIVWGHDGWLYLALGDHGCNVPRPEGDRLVVEGGGILRCRPDGRDLHVFATGLRNIYDVALDEYLNVFVRDNENDGGDYKIRVCHSFFGADHGYPYLYYERPDEAMPPLADLGLGSSAGGLVYLERQFPAEYRGNLFFCEWGRAVVRYVPRRAGSGFAPLEEIEFAAGAPSDPYGFKPTDLVVERDGSLIVADWADGQQPKRGRGRIYRIRYVGEAVERITGIALPSPREAARGVGGEGLFGQLDSESYYDRVAAQVALERQGETAARSLTDIVLRRQLGVRGRMHAIHTIAHVHGPDAIDDLVSVARSDPDARVRAQAVRAVADLADAVLAQDRLAADRADSALAKRLAELATDADPSLMLELVIAVGRLRWPQSPIWIGDLPQEPDSAMAHAAMQTVRLSANWPATVALLDRPATETARSVALRAIAGQYEVPIVDALVGRLWPGTQPDPERRRQYADLLTRVYRRPGPWVYWGYRPPPRPANTVEWERTHAIQQAINRMLLDPNRTVRLTVLRRMQRERIPTIPDTLEEWLTDERDSERVAVILDSLKEHSPSAVREMLLAIVRDIGHTAANRTMALGQVIAGLDDASERHLIDLARTLEEGSVLAAVLNESGKRPRLEAGELLIGKLSSSEPEVRAAATDALAELAYTAGGKATRRLLRDADPRVRRAAAAAMGKLLVRPAADELLQMTGDADASVRGASFRSLRLLGDGRSLPPALEAIVDSATALDAMLCIGEFGTPEHTGVIAEIAKRHASRETLAEAIRILMQWRAREDLSIEAQTEIDRAVAEIHGSTGVLASWKSLGPLSADAASKIAHECSGSAQPLSVSGGEAAGWIPTFPAPLDYAFSVNPTRGTDARPDNFYVCLSDVVVADGADVQFLASSNGTLRVWLNGRPVHERAQAGAYRPESDRFDGVLTRGVNRVVVVVSSGKPSSPIFHTRFRRKSSQAQHEALVQAALSRPGNAERGGKLFFDAEKSQCIKCHRLGDQGERFGPDLTGLGSRFARIHIIESILEPSRTIAPSYESVTVALTDGRVLSGLRVAETDITLTLADSQAAKHVFEKSVIEERRVQPTSIMPEGLEKRLTADEFVDLIAFLVNQRGSVPTAEIGQ